MALVNWVCNHCLAVVQKDSSFHPQGSSRSCPVNGNHAWTNCGEVGTSQYQCSNCGTIVFSKDRPRGSTASCGGDRAHKWNLLSTGQNASRARKSSGSKASSGRTAIGTLGFMLGIAFGIFELFRRMPQLIGIIFGFIILPLGLFLGADISLKYIY